MYGRSGNTERHGRESRENEILRRLASSKRKHHLIDKLAAACGLDRSELDAILERMEAEGHLVRTRKGRVALAHRLGLASGTLKVGRRGRAVVVTDEGGESVAVDGNSLRPALDGDRVLVELLPYRRRGRPAGSVKRVLARGRGSISATLAKRGERVLAPTDPRIGYLAVLDDDSPCPQPQEVVVASITAYPSSHSDLKVRVERALGPAGSLPTEIESVCHFMGIAEAFSPEAEEEAARLEGPGPDSVAGRLDLRGRTVITIDPADARDFDDAVAIEPKDGGGWRLAISIADLAHYVRPGSALDEEARQRSTSVYLPGRAIHMLPRRLSADLASLRPQVDRLCVTVSLDVQADGRVASASFAPSIIHSAARLSYEEAQAILKAGAGALSAELGAMADCADRLRQQRMGRGALDMDIAEATVTVDSQGEPLSVLPRARLAVHRLIEEFMLAANQAVAQELTRRKTPFLYRIHERPDAETIARLAGRLSLLGLRVDREGAEREPRVLQKVLTRAKGRRSERAVALMVLRSLERARYSASQAVHFGLASQCYTHFTSPIRRYPDLVVHRALASAMGWRQDWTEDRGRLEDCAEHCSRRERRAAEAERDLTRAAAIILLAGRVGQVFSGTVSSVERFGYFVELEEVLCEGFVPVGRLDEYYDHFPERMELRSRTSGDVIAIGERVKVRLTAAELADRSIELEPAGSRNR